jgi:hypothetical protein
VNPDEILRRGRVGRWRVVRLIAEGGFSFVFEVEDERSGKRLALKMLKPEAAKGEEYRRFWKEAKILAAQDDPHLVAIVMLDSDEELGVDYYVMELLTGRTLAQLLKESEPPAERVVEIFLGALRGLARLHAVRPPVIHRDIKPVNIQITADGRAKVLDLGIAGTQRDDGGQTVSGADDTYTTTATFKGTPKYASPEQLQILGLDTSSDVFSMGLCLFEALEGRHPYSDQPDLPTVSYQSVLGFYARLEASRKELSLNFRRTPKAMQSVVRKALSLRPADRYRTALEMRRALAAAAQGRDFTTGARPSDRESTREASSSQRWLPLAAGATGLALVLVAGIGVYLVIRDGRGGETDGTQVSTATQAGRPTAAPTVERPPLEGPTGAQEQARSDAAAVVAEVERLRTEGSADADDAARVIERQHEGDARWSARRFADAERAYRAAISEGNQVIHGARDRSLAQQRQAAEQSRAAADEANADENAPTEWSSAEALLGQARSAAAEDAGRLYASARDAHEAARTQAEKALGAAQAGEKSALAARARLPGKGDCGAIDEPKAKRACGTGASALADGSAALDAKNAASALESFQVAKRNFDDARRLIPSEPRPIASNRPPTLSLTPSGSLSLERGKTRTIQADPRDPEGKAVEVTFTIREPGGTRRTSSGENLSFQPDQKGDYRIEAVGTDAEGARSQPAILVVTVIEPKSSGGGTTGRGVDPDVTAAVRQTLDEYADALSNCEVDTLRTVFPRVVPLFRSYMTADCKLAASVTAVGQPELLNGGDRARQQISQSIHTVTKEGERLRLVEGPAVATLTRRADGWYIDSILSGN